MLMKPMLMKQKIPPRRRDLTPPELPQATFKDGVYQIDVSQITGDIVVQVDRYIGMKHGDRLVGYFGVIRGQPQIVPYDPVTLPTSVPLLFDRHLPSGNYEVYYTAEDRLNNLGTSPSILVKIINTLSGNYPPPEFPDAVDGVISYRSIIARGGVRIRARYSEILPSDQVTFNWSGTDADGNFVPASIYTSGPIPVTSVDQSNGYVETLIPQQYVLVLGDDGIGTGCYVVQPLGGDKHPSAPGSVTISWEDLYTTALCVMTDAPIIDTDNYPYLEPCNRVSVFGRPALVLTAAVSPGALIDGVMATALITLDENGLSSFQVSSKSTGTVAVNVYSPLEEQPAVQHMTFQPYHQGTAGIYGYRASTGAPNDGYTPCSVYIMAENGVTSVDATVITGSALINGWTQSGTFPVHKDGTGTLNIIDDVAETVTLTLRATGNANPAQPITFTFVEFPNFKV